MTTESQQNYITIYIPTTGEWKHVQPDTHITISVTSNNVTPQLSSTQFYVDGPSIFFIQGHSGEGDPMTLNNEGEYTTNQYEFEVESFETIQQGDVFLGLVNTTSGVKIILGDPSLNDYYRGPFPPITLNSNTNTTAVCFLEGTAITTDQGPIAIEQLTQNNTIYGSKVNNITESNNFFGHLIHFKPNALANNLPSTDTFLTPTHAIFCPKDKCMKMAKDFCDGENVVEDFTKDKTCKIYNVVCEDDNGDITAHSMYVNNMLCECLHPHAYPLVKNQLKW